MKTLEVIDKQGLKLLRCPMLLLERLRSANYVENHMLMRGRKVDPPSIVNMRQYRRLRQWTGYVLRCYKNTYYVGITYRPDFRIERHVRDCGSGFTKMFPPIAVVELYFCNTKKEAHVWEGKTVKEMRKQFPNNIIGGTTPPKALLNKYIY
mgnify:CR=1 FL=1